MCLDNHIQIPYSEAGKRRDERKAQRIRIEKKREREKKGAKTLLKLECQHASPGPFFPSLHRATELRTTHSADLLSSIQEAFGLSPRTAYWFSFYSNLSITHFFLSLLCIPYFHLFFIHSFLLVFFLIFFMPSFFSSISSLLSAFTFHFLIYALPFFLPSLFSIIFSLSLSVPISSNFFFPFHFLIHAFLFYVRSLLPRFCFPF